MATTFPSTNFIWFLPTSLVSFPEMSNRDWKKKVTEIEENFSQVSSQH